MQCKPKLMRHFRKKIYVELVSIALMRSLTMFISYQIIVKQLKEQRSQALFSFRRIGDRSSLYTNSTNGGRANISTVEIVETTVCAAVFGSGEVSG